jgi:DUF1365 family protein
VRFGKDFHVSPFLPMDLDYEWRIAAPGPELHVHMANERAGERVFDATLSLQRREISSTALAGALLGHPLMTVKVVAAIYWQALRLWLKGATFYTHPKHAEPLARIEGRGPG